ncbi:phosphotransferase [Psychromonas sp. KJ10-10]|uniref:phosphotransferase n=1 Tax=Psychromonas sp. KJ10-10 TaxID=3391823 RepID=UPI0039B68611
MLKAELCWLKKQGVSNIVNTEKFNNALTNEVFLITNSDATHYIFKRLNQNARSNEDRQAEFLVQELASQHHLTPDVLAHNEKYKLQQFIEGELISKDADNLFECLINQLSRIHQLPTLYAPKQRLALELLRLHKQLKGTVDNAVFEKMLALAEQLDQSCPMDTLCHGDLSLNNVLIGSDKQLYALDWEYAVIACLAYDLAFCCCINAFTPDQSNKLISLYYQKNCKALLQTFDSLQKQCDLYFQVFTYINELWALCFLEKDN